MSWEGGEARDLLRPASNHLHRPGQQVIKLPHVLSVVSWRAPRTLLALVKGRQRDQVEESGGKESVTADVLIRSSFV